MITNKVNNNQKVEHGSKMDFYDSKGNYKFKKKRRFKTSGGRRVGGRGGMRSAHTRKRSF